MIRSRLFINTFFLLLLIAVMYSISIVLHLSWSLWWYDVILHFLSGFCVGMATILFVVYGMKIKVDNKLKLILFAVLGAIFIGVVWEIYEVSFGMTFFSDGIVYIRDTASDLIIDTCGGFFGALYSYKLLMLDKKRADTMII